MTTSMSVNSASDDVLDQTMQAPDEKTFWRKMKASVMPSLKNTKHKPEKN
nr:hypothetical protein [Vibrio alginolyticus]